MKLTDLIEAAGARADSVPAFVIELVAALEARIDELEKKLSSGAALGPLDDSHPSLAETLAATAASPNATVPVTFSTGIPGHE